MSSWPSLGWCVGQCLNEVVQGHGGVGGSDGLRGVPALSSTGYSRCSTSPSVKNITMAPAGQGVGVVVAWVGDVDAEGQVRVGVQGSEPGGLE